MPTRSASRRIPGQASGRTWAGSRQPGRRSPDNHPVGRAAAQRLHLSVGHGPRAGVPLVQLGVMHKASLHRHGIRAGVGDRHVAPARGVGFGEGAPAAGGRGGGEQEPQVDSKADKTSTGNAARGACRAAASCDCLMLAGTAYQLLVGRHTACQPAGVATLTPPGCRACQLAR